MIGSDGASPDILGVEITPTVVRAVRLNRDRKVIRGAECPVLTIGDAVTLDPSAIGPALDEVLYQLGVDDRTEHLAAVSIGPRRAGVGSGPALPAWLEHRARQLGENIVCAGKLGISFCPQRALDTAIMICEQANITVSRIDFAPVAAARTLERGTDTITLGSGRGWRARLRDDEVLEALEAAEVSFDDPLMVVDDDGAAVVVESLHGVSLASDVKSSVGARPACFAVAVGAAVGIIDGSSGNLLDGDTVRGRQVPAAFASEVGGVNTGEIAGSRTTVSLARAEPEARSVIRQVGTVVEQPDESPAGGVVVDDEGDVVADASDVEDDTDAELLGGALDVAIDEGDNPHTSLSEDRTATAIDDVDGEDKPETHLLGQLIDEDGVEWSPVRSDAKTATVEESPVDLRADDIDFSGETRPGATGVGVTESKSVSVFGFESDSPTGALQADSEIHPDDPIHDFSPEPGAEAAIVDRRGQGRGLALVVAGLILFSLAIAIGILMTQG